MTATWQSRYPQERGPIESAAAQVAPQNALETVADCVPAPAAAPFECHDFRDYGTHELKRGETACNMAVSTQPGDLDIFSRPLKPGS